MSTQPTPAALSAAKLINRGKAPVSNLVFQVEIENAKLIDREAVKPATAELLEACKILHKRLELGAETHDESVRSLVTDSEIYRWFSSVIAKHEART